MENMKTFENWLFDRYNDGAGEIEVNKEENALLSEVEETELEHKNQNEELTKKSLLIAQRNSSPTYYNHSTQTTEVTPGINSKRRSMQSIRDESK